jgi:type I restriction enzyme S subunit
MKNKVSINDSCHILDYLRVPLNGEERKKIKGNIPYYGANGVQGYINNYIFNDDLILLAEDGGNFEEYQNRPIAYRISGKSWVNNHAHILKAKDGYDQDFIFYSIVHKDGLFG